LVVGDVVKLGVGKGIGPEGTDSLGSGRSVGVLLSGIRLNCLVGAERPAGWTGLPSTSLVCPEPFHRVPAANTAVPTRTAAHTRATTNLPVLRCIPATVAGPRDRIS
jgi:hypothetical protein